MKRYEIIFIIQADLPREEIEALIENYKSSVGDLKGIPIRVDKWGAKRLAYRVNKQIRGFYVLFDLVGEPALVAELERRFKYDDKILRYLTIRKADTVDLKEIEQEIAGPKEEKTEEAKEPTAAGEAEKEPSRAEENNRKKPGRKKAEESKPSEEAITGAE